MAITKIADRIFETDVLVVGGGGAGAMAAIKAMAAGVDVLVATKGPFPSGNTSIAGWGYAVALGHADPRDNPQVHFEDIIRNGRELNNRKVVRAWVNEIIEVTKEMDGWGIDLIRNGDKFDQTLREGHTYARVVHHQRTTGKAVTQCLSNKSKDMNIPVLEHTIVGGLLKKEGAVVGAWGIEYPTGQLLFIRAKAVVLATGGVGHLFPITSYVKGVTGEGYTLAFRAGAELTEMEMCHFTPTICYPEKMKGIGGGGTIRNLLENGGARLYNARGEMFMKRQFPDACGEDITSEELTRTIGIEICERGTAHGGIYIDLSDVPPEMQKTDFTAVWDAAARAGVDLSYQPVELSSGPHDQVGGIRIDETASTNVPALFAAGEAAGSAHGASRFFGAALSEALAFGAIAGKSAADHAKRMKNKSPLDESQLTEVKHKIETLMSTNGNVKPSTVKRKVQKVAFHYLNAGRNEKGLKRALSEIERLERNMLHRMTAQAKDQDQKALRLQEAIEVDGQLELAKIMATAALHRQESRGGYFGGHYRSDYPLQDDENWLKNIILKRDSDGTISYRTTQPVMED